MEADCEYYFDHDPGETCKHCGLEVDDYGNTEADFLNCCFPDCGCDGQRLCMAPSGANSNAMECNVEGMYQRKGRVMYHYLCYDLAGHFLGSHYLDWSQEEIAAFIERKRRLAQHIQDCAEQWVDNESNEA